jgi:hypothetical protein
MNVTRHAEREMKLLAGQQAWLMIESKKAPQDFAASKLVYIDEIHRRAETVTPLLKGILDFRPEPNWHH